MQWVKQIDKRHIYLGVFVFLFLITRLPRIHNDIINPDSVNWHFRSEQFVNGLKHNQLEKTYQHYQPGVTLMWILGGTVEVLKQLYPDQAFYSETTFPTYHMFSKISLIGVQLVLTIISIYLLERVFNTKIAYLVAALFTFEPFFLGNSRVLHLDVLLTLFLFNGLLLSYWHLKERVWWQGVLAGVFFGLAFLSKSVGMGGFLFAAGVGGLYIALKEDIKAGIAYALPILLSAIAVILVLFPAFWVIPETVFQKLYKGIADIGLHEGHGEIFFGNYSRDPGPLFYPVVLLVKSSPFLVLGFITVLITKKWGKLKEEITSMSPVTFLTIFYVGYLVVMTIGSKKIDRYMLPMYPYLATIVVLGLFLLREKLNNLVFRIIFVVLMLISFVYPVFKQFPYYFTYTNPMFGTAEFVHENIVAQKPFGVGMYALKEFILKNYQCAGNVSDQTDKPVCERYPPVSILDPKPMFWIYDKDQLKYTKIDGTSNYKLLVLGVNEDFPGRVLESRYDFVYDDSLYINGLEYWKVYVRKDKAE